MIGVSLGLQQSRAGEGDEYAGLPGTRLAHWRAEDAGVADMAEVLSLVDRVNGYTLVALEGALSGGPTYIEDVLNGFPVLSFDGSEANLYTQDAGLISALTFAQANQEDQQAIIVARSPTLDATERYLYALTNAAQVRTTLANRNDIKILRRRDDNGTNAVSTSSVSSGAVNVWEIWEYRHDPSTGTQRFWIDGTLEDSDTPASFGEGYTPTVLSIGSYNAGGLPRLNVEIAEIVVFTGASEADLAAWRGHFETKYAI